MMKSRKSILACLMMAVFMLSLCACGDDSQPTQNGDTNVSDTEIGSGSEDPVLPAEDEYEYEVALAGAELFTDGDGEDALRVYYDFTNNSEVTKSALMALSIVAQQAGADLETAYTSYDAVKPESEYFGLGIRPGVTIRCAEEYKVDPNGGNVTLAVSRGWLDDNPLNFEVDLAALTAPADEFLIAAIDDPAWTDALSDEGAVDEVYNVYIDNAEIVENWEGQEVLRVYFDFANNSDTAQSFLMACTAFAYQDGVQLAADYSTNSVEEDANYSIEIEPGETIRVTRCFALRSDSEVEVEIADSMGTSVLGTSYTIE